MSVAKNILDISSEQLVNIGQEAFTCAQKEAEFTCIKAKYTARKFDRGNKCKVVNGAVLSSVVNFIRKSHN